MVIWSWPTTQFFFSEGDVQSLYMYMCELDELWALFSLIGRVKHFPQWDWLVIINWSIQFDSIILWGLIYHMTYNHHMKFHIGSSLIILNQDCSVSSRIFPSFNLSSFIFQTFLSLLLQHYLPSNFILFLSYHPYYSTILMSQSWAYNYGSVNKI